MSFKLSTLSLEADSNALISSQCNAMLTAPDFDLNQLYEGAQLSHNALTFLIGCQITAVAQVGTAVVTRGKDRRLALGRLGALVEQLEALVRSGREVILVTSGGVSVGKQKLMQQKVLNSSPLEMQMNNDGYQSIKSKFHPWNQKTACRL